MPGHAAVFAVLLALAVVAPAGAGELPTAFTPLSEAELAATRAGRAPAAGSPRTEPAAGVRAAAIGPVRVQGGRGITVVHINEGRGSTQMSRIDIDISLAPDAVLDLGSPPVRR